MVDRLYPWTASPPRAHIDPDGAQVVTHERRGARRLVEHTGGGWRRWYVVDAAGRAYGPMRRGQARRALRTWARRGE